jgi:hypothetical protein
MRVLAPGAVFVIGVGLFAGCNGEPPLATDGPNQILFKVSAMT